MPSVETYLTDPIVAPKNYRDEFKIAAYIAETRAAQIADAGLDVDLCEIAAIAITDTEMTAVHHGGEWTERRMLEWLWSQTRDTTLVGFNCVAFDLPIVLRRSLYLNILTPPIHVDKYRHDGVIDVAEVLSYNWRMPWRSLEFYCGRFGIPYDNTVRGDDIATLAAQGEWPSIARHCLNDVQSTAALALRVGLVYGPAVTL